MKKYFDGANYEFLSIGQYETLISAIPGGVVITGVDEKFTVLYANQGFFDLVGYGREEYIERFHRIGVDMLHPEDSLKAVNSAREQMAKTGSFVVKGRLSHKQKGFIWVQFSGKQSKLPGEEMIAYIMIVDISHHQLTLEKLEKERAFNELIASLSEEAFFDCDLIANTMRYSKNFAQKLGIKHISADCEEAFIQLGLMTKENLEEQKKRFSQMEEGIFEQELQFKSAGGEDIWYLYRYSVLKDLSGTPIRIVGKFIDITRHKIQIDELAQLAQRDQLTGLYNKTATESLIKETLNRRRKYDDNCALMIVDIDNFKNVNDKLGHLYGDAVLTQLAEHLLPLFRSDDIVGRVGGDEFFVFLKNYRTYDILVEKAQEMCSLFHKTYSEGDTFVTISASIGIALCPDQGTEFDDLYLKADAALYDAKARGKNTFSFFSSNLEQSYMSERTEIDANAIKKSFKDNRIEYVFRLLYDSGNPAASIQSVLQLVTESFGFSRGYIFETAPDGKYTSNTFEWCTKGITAEILNLQNVPIEAVATANVNFNETGMFILKRVCDLPEIEREILEPQGIRSMFQFGIMDRGKLVGFIGFDDCISERIPTDAQIDEICTVCHVLATFLLKHRGSERDIRHHEAVETVMNHINSYAYVIDHDNYQVLYENRNVVDITGGVSVGQKCHLAYRGNKEPCSDCPMPRFQKGENKHIEEVHNEKFDIYVLAEATLIDWSDSKKACLICGIDISEYKKE